MEHTCGQKLTGQGIYAQVPLGGFQSGRTYLTALVPTVWGCICDNSSRLRDLSPYSANGSRRKSVSGLVLTPRWRRGLGTQMLWDEAGGIGHLKIWITHLPWFGGNVWIFHCFHYCHCSLLGFLWQAAWTTSPQFKTPPETWSGTKGPGVTRYGQRPGAPAGFPQPGQMLCSGLPLC